jgi:anti-sigma B factor antagonist
MDIAITNFKRCDVVKANGRIDSYTSPDLEKAFNEITEAGKFKIVFDMSDVNFVSSKGWWVLIDNQKKCRRYKRGEVVLANIQKDIQESLGLVGLSNYFKVFDDVTSAVGSF